MKKTDNVNIDYDAQWKEVISSLFPDFIKFFLPKAYKTIDFQQSIEFLEQELHLLIADKYKVGKVINDKLVKVKLKNGEDKWILIHIEVQSSFESDFNERMFTYFYRIYDRYNQKITALAIYTGQDVPKNHKQFEYSFFGTEITYKYNSFLVKDQKEQELINNKNPFAIVILASKYLIKAKDNHDKLYQFKLELIRLAKEKNYQADKIVYLLRFIDFVLKLPSKLSLEFDKEIFQTYLNSEKMTTRKSQRFANQIHLALYGETFDDKMKKEKIIEKTFIVQKLINMNVLNINQIAEAVNESIEFVKRVKENQEKK